MRLIDGDRLYETLHEIRMDEVAKYGRNDTKHCCSLSTALFAIQNTPTVDPMKYGRWCKHYSHEDGERDGVQCSECGVHYYFGGKLMNYCPNCGARMEGEEDE